MKTENRNVFATFYERTQDTIFAKFAQQQATAEKCGFSSYACLQVAQFYNDYSVIASCYAKALRERHYLTRFNAVGGVNLAFGLNY